MKGFNELLDALGCKQNVLEKIKLVLLFWAATAGFSIILSLGHLFEINELSSIVFHIITWSIWLIWQSLIFSHNSKEKTLQNYRKIFYTQILPGITFGVALMMRPLSYGLFSNTELASWPIMILAGIPMFIGITLLFYGFREIGVTGSSFLTEYYEKPEKYLITSGIYAYIRHPIFLGGMIGALGAGMIFPSLLTFLLILINICILPFYIKIEDSRMKRIFGDQFVKYCQKTRGIFPKRLKKNSDKR